jgi:hypothetical protein
MFGLGDDMFQRAQLRPVAAIVAAALLLTSCATVNADGTSRPRTALERSIGQCLVSVGLGALVGALIGAAVNRRGGAGTGAAIGAGAGAVACAIILAVNNAEDRQRIADSEQKAYSTGQSQTARYTGSDGRERLIQTSVQTVPLPHVAPDNGAGQIVGPCRRAQTTISISGQGGSAPLGWETVCRTSQGNYVPIDNPTT